MSVEVAPYAKVGGLADVAGSLPKALRKLGHDVRVVMPAYQMVLDDPRWIRERVLPEFDVKITPEFKKKAFADCLDMSGVPVYLVGTDEWFTEATSSEKVYSHGVEKYEFFSEAVLALSRELGWQPDVIHCNDWHSGFIPVLMREKHRAHWEGTGSIFTIHNFAYQGEFGPEILDDFGLSQRLFHPDHAEAWGRVNFLKSGCTYADEVNTVSPTYAREIQTPDFGCHLEGLMTHLHEQGRLTGILNGIDREAFDPEHDPFLPTPFSAAHPEGKADSRAALLAKVGMDAIEGAPVLGVVSRLSSQKGLDLLVHTAEALFALPTQLIVQGLGDPALAEALRDLQKRYPDHLRFVEKFDESMAQLVYAGCDMFLMPSSFEPCGLGQMIALRYGTIPVVRRTGGLADTIFEGKNGFVFDRKEPATFLAAVARACATYRSPSKWSTLVQEALTSNLGWDQSANAYVRLYEKAISHRKPNLLAAGT